MYLKRWAAISALLHLAIAASTGCNEFGSVAPPQHILPNVRTVLLNLSQHDWGYPVGIAYAKQPGIAFASLSRNLSSDPSSLVVLDTSSFVPTVIRDIPYPNSEAGSIGGTGITVSTDGRFAYAAAGHGAFVVDASLAATKGSDPIVGFLNSANKKEKPGHSAFSAVISTDDKYLFVFQEYGPQGIGIGDVDAFKLSPSTGLGTAIGFIRLGLSVTGGAFSPDGKYLYVTSEEAVPDPSSKKLPPGTLSVLEVAKLEEDPKKALIASIKTGCGAVRAVVSSDGKTAWVANRADNTVWAFDTDKILSDPENAHIATVDVGTAPVGLILVKNGTRLLVANSNRFHDVYSPDYVPSATAGISVIDVQTALKDESGANLGQIPSGYFPRNFAQSADGKTVLVSNFSSQQIMVIDVDAVP